jgi:hypothetical protein
VTSIQPATVSLFSSTGSEPLKLFSKRSDDLLPADSFVHFLHDTTSQPSPSPPAVLIHPPSLTADDDERSTVSLGRTLHQTVMHVQSPTLTTTYIQCPPDIAPRSDSELGMKHPWINIQVRNMGREWSFEFGVVDTAGRKGVVRCSTFQVHPYLSGCTPFIWSCNI